ncbi:MAG: hypothetical protein C4536_11570 [Actinobacteria bacterium]|nr:MAG: hypothetical protein C4536_11570 [Actinomycetota bacterium]
MFTSRTFIIFLIPVVFLGLLLWFVASIDLDGSDVKVAGALTTPTRVELSVNSSHLTSQNGMRKLVVEMAGRNTSSIDVNLNPGNFQLILAASDNPTGSISTRRVFNPMNYTSKCDEAPASLSRIPVDAVRSVTLVFYGETLPSGDEWDDYLLSLEYYDTATPIMLSTLLNPTEE